MSNQVQIEEVDEEFEPAKEVVISNLETLKVISDPTRLRIMEVLTEQALTVKQIARKLDTSPTKLYYHISLLEEHGMIVVTRSRIVSGIIEKQYRGAAQSLRVARELLTINGNQADQGVDALLSVVFDATRSDVLRGIQKGLIHLEAEDPVERNAMLMRTITRFTPEEYERFYTRFRELLKEFSGSSELSKEVPPNTTVYGLTIALYPFADHNPDVEEETADTAHWMVD